MLYWQQCSQVVTALGCFGRTNFKPVNPSLKPLGLFIKNNMRTTQENITNVGQNEVFVFGSNESGRHGKGAAKTALSFGAKWGQARGLQGRSYGIPTKDYSIRRTLSVSEIKVYVDEFIEFASLHPEFTFLVTEIGCGLAGHKSKDIALLFSKCKDMENVHLPQVFWNEVL